MRGLASIRPPPVAPATIQLSKLAAAASSMTQAATSFPVGSIWWCTSARTIVGVRFAWKKAGAPAETVRIRVWVGGVAQVIGAASATYVEASVSSDGLQADVAFPAPLAIAAITQFTVSLWRSDSAGYVYWTTGVSAVTLPNYFDTGGVFGPHLVGVDSGRYGAATGDIEPTTTWNPGAGIATVDPLLDV